MRCGSSGLELGEREWQAVKGGVSLLVACKCSHMQTRSRKDYYHSTFQRARGR